jgi:hypothetical protein
MARFFGGGFYKIGNVRIIPAEDNNHLVSAEQSDLRFAIWAR